MGVFASAARAYHRMKPYYKKLKMDHKQVMLDLQTLKTDHTETSEKLDDLAMETDVYCYISILAGTPTVMELPTLLLSLHWSLCNSDSNLSSISWTLAS